MFIFQNAHHIPEWISDALGKHYYGGDEWETFKRHQRQTCDVRRTRLQNEFSFSVTPLRVNEEAEFYTRLTTEVLCVRPCDRFAGIVAEAGESV